MKRIEEIYVALWCILMPITGTLVIPRVQGTIPAYMMAFGSLVLVFLKIRSWNVPSIVVRYLTTFFSIVFLWLFLLAGSQLGHLISDRRDFGNIHMVDGIDNTIVLRDTLFTQSLYLLACVLIALFFRYFFQERWMRYILWGGYFLAIYGIYEWIFFIVFHETGDFLVNRSFFGGHSASWSQVISFEGLNLLRIKSTLGEPSFFAAAVIPYLFLAIDRGKITLSMLLLFTAVFSTSTSCYIALSACLLVRTVWTGELRWAYLTILVFVGVFLGCMALLYPDSFQDLFVDKFKGYNESGAIRLNDMYSEGDLLQTYSTMNWIFGIGMGYTYLRIPDALLINCGVIGLITFVWVFVRPVWLLPMKPGYGGLKTGLFGFLILCALALTEFYIPTTWMFIGLAYYKLEEYRKLRQAAVIPVQPTKVLTEIPSS